MFSDRFPTFVCSGWFPEVAFFDSCTFELSSFFLTHEDARPFCDYRESMRGHRNMRIRQLSGLTDVAQDDLVLSVGISEKPSPILLYSLGVDHKATLLRVLCGPTGVSLTPFAMEAVPWSSTASESAPLVIVGTQDSEILVFDADSGDMVNRLPMGGSSQSVFRFKSVPKWNPRELFVGGIDFLGRCDLELGETTKVRVEKTAGPAIGLPAHLGRTCFRGIVGDSSRGVLYAGSMDRSVSVISLRTNQFEAGVATQGSVTSLGLTDDTNTLLVGTRDRGFGLLDVRTLRQRVWINALGKTNSEPHAAHTFGRTNMRWVEVFDQLDHKSAVLGGTVGCWVFRLLDGALIERIHEAEQLEANKVKDIFGILALRRPVAVLDRVEEEERIKYLLGFLDDFDCVDFVRISVRCSGDLAAPRWTLWLA